MLFEELDDGRETMTTEKGKFAKPRANTVVVDASAIQDMQRGYETRIARQAEAITRLLRTLEERTNDVHDHMTRANEAAAKVLQDAPAPALTAWANDAQRFTGELSEADLDELMKLIPPDWDLYNEDDTPRTILTGYINWCTSQVSDARDKQRLLVTNYQDPMMDLIRGLGQEGLPYIAKGMNGAEAALAVIQQIKRELATAAYDARANAEIANSAIRAQHAAQTVEIGEIGDETPPWEEPGPEAFVASVSVEPTAAIPEPIEVGADREVLSWDGAAQLMRHDEQRPGSF
jgi:hypothetical protein